MEEPKCDENTVQLQIGENEHVVVGKNAKVLEVDRKYAMLKVEPKSDEAGDRNFPPHLHAAFELFCMTRNFHMAKRLKECTDAFLMILSLGPDGTKSQSLGTAAVCWGCGYVGLPKNPDAGENAIAQCSGCGSNEQTNYVKVKQPQGTVIPWMENKVGIHVDKASAAAAAQEEHPVTERQEVPSVAKVGAKKTVKVKPNEQCTCSSGKKFKKCCGLGV